MDKGAPHPLSAVSGAILQALDRSGLAVSIVAERPDGPHRVYASPAYAEMLGHRTAELLALPPLELSSPRMRADFVEMRRRFREDGGLATALRTALAHRDGTEIPVEATFAFHELGGETLVIGFFRDLTDELAIAGAARESEANFRVLAEAAPDSIAVTRNGELLYVNPFGAGLLGFDDPAALIGRNLREFLLPEEAALMAQRLQRQVAGEQLEPREYCARRIDGSSVIVEIASIPIEYHGAPAVLAIGREVSARKQLESELLQADRMATVGTLAAGVAHEINNPLTYVLLHLERMWRTIPGLIGDADQLASIQTMIGEAIEGAERMSSIVRDLLAFSRPDNRDQRRVDVRNVLDSTVKLAATGLKHRAQIVTHYDDVPAIIGNPSKLGQVFLNLLVNALQAVEDIGRQGEVSVELRDADGDWISVAVTDNGPGIAPELLSRIFDPFFTTKPVGTGTGLGLPISRSIADSMGGSIEISNRDPAGAHVELRLPVGDPPAAAEPARAARRRATGAPRHGAVLIVDDEVNVGRALAALLGERYRTQLCTCGAEALELMLGERSFDAVFCDVGMPAPSGIDVYLQLTEARPEYATRFAFITGGPTTDRAARALDELGAPILAKPFDVDDVLALAARLIPSH